MNNPFFDNLNDNARKMYEPWTRLNKAMLKNAEKMNAFSLETMRHYSDLGLEQLRNVSQIDSPESASSFNQKQSELLNELGQKMLADAQRLTELGAEIRSEIMNAMNEAYSNNASNMQTAMQNATEQATKNANEFNRKVSENMNKAASQVSENMNKAATQMSSAVQKTTENMSQAASSMTETANNATNASVEAVKATTAKITK